MRRLLLSLALLLTIGAGCASAQVVFDANATAPCVANGVAGATGATCATLTVGAGANRAVLCAVNLSTASGTSGTITGVWDSGGTNQTMDKIGCANSTQPTQSCLYGRVGPTSGAKTAKFTWTGTADIISNCTAFTGVDQTGGATSFPHFNSATGSGTAVSVTITSATNNFTISTASEDANAFSSVGNTQTFLNNTGTNVSAAGERATGAATVSHTATISGAGAPWAIVGTDILAAGGAAACTDSHMLGVWRCDDEAIR